MTISTVRIVIILTVAGIAGCSMGPYTTPDTPLDLSQIFTTDSGCKVRTTPQNHFDSASWSGPCNASGFAQGSGVLIDHYTFEGRPGTYKVTGTMSNGYIEGSYVAEQTFYINNALYLSVTHANAVNGQPVGEATVSNYIDGVFDDTSSVIRENGEVTVRQTASGPASSIFFTPPSSSNSTSDDDDSGIQLVGAILSTAIQAKAMHDTASAANTMQQAAVQRAQANTAALALAQQQAALQAQQAAANKPAAEPAKPMWTGAYVPPSKPAPAPQQTSPSASMPSQSSPPVSTGQSAATDQSPPQFSATYGTTCQDESDQSTCMFNVSIRNESSRGILCNLDVSFNRYNSVTGGSDALSAHDVGFVPAGQTSVVSSNLGFNGSYSNLACSF